MTKMPIKFLDILRSTILGYKLVSKRNLNQFPVLKIQVETSGRKSQVLLINGEQAAFLISPKFTAGSFQISGDDVAIERIGLMASIRLYILCLLQVRKKKYLNFQNFKVQFGGPEPTKRLLIYTNKLLTRLNSRPDSLMVHRHPELLLGWGKDGVQLEKCLEPKSIGAKLAIVLHVYYPETWPELAEVLNNIEFAYDLFVTCVAGQADLIARISHDFPEASIRIMENQGRDVRPFLVLLEDETLSKYDYICKIHGKRSLANDPSGNLGDICRRRTLFDLLVAPGSIQSIIRRFDANPNIGMIGSKAFRLNRERDHNIFWRANREHMKNVIVRLGGNPDQVRPDFFEGTMFWVRGSALEGLKSLSLSCEFADEQGLKDGALEHAVERLFAVAIVLAGCSVEDTDGLDSKCV